MENFATLIRHGSIFQKLKNNFLCEEINPKYEQTFRRYVLGILYLISLSFIIWLCLYPYFKSIIFTGLVFNIYSTIYAMAPSSDIIKRLIPVYLIILILYLFFLILVTLMFWPSCILMLYFLCIPLMLLPIYPWKIVLKWIRFVFYSIVAAFLTFYLLKTMYPRLIDQGIPVLSAEKMLIYDLLVIIFCFLLLSYCVYYNYQLNKIRVRDLLHANGSSIDEYFGLNLMTQSKEYEKYEKIYLQIVVYFEEKAPYLNAEFSSAQMAHDLKINIAYLSKAIQLHSGMNFNGLVNFYRINKIKEMLSSNSQQYTLQHVYMACGFKSQSAFNKAFKMQEGITPSEYMKTLKS